MKMIYKGIVTKYGGGKFTVRMDDKVFDIFARGNLKADKIFVGDEVETDGEVIKRVCKRRNHLKRPIIANIDQIVIVISQTPVPDLLLIDKLIMFANLNTIDTVICVNKSDISSKLYDEIVRQYKDVVYKIVRTSAINGQIEELKEVLKGKISVFVGQSAVGKSTLLNVLFGIEIAKTGDMSKIERGKNTTRDTILYTLDSKSFIADTPGFSCLELDNNITPEQISAGYTEFYELSKDCKYKQCDHIYVDKCDCRVLRELEINPDLMMRYERYKDLFDKTREKWRKRYGKKTFSDSKYTSGKK